MYSYTLDSWQGRLIACYRDSCDQLTPLGWEQWKATLYPRIAHTSAVTPQGLLLVGGLVYGTHTTTELLPWDEGESWEGFRLEASWAYHCSIQVTDSTFALTGGQFTGSQVTEFSLDSGEDVISRELPRLLNDRAFHACGVYMAGDEQVILPQSPVHSLSLSRCCWSLEDWLAAGPWPAHRCSTTTLQVLFYCVF